MSKLQRCRKCKIDKPLKEFNFRCKKEGKRRYDCKTCTRKDGLKHYRDNKAIYMARSRTFSNKLRDINRDKVVEYLLEHPCACGEKDPLVLTFDTHGDLLISELVGRAWTWKSVKARIDKSDVVCLNCQAKRKAYGASYVGSR